MQINVTITPSLEALAAKFGKINGAKILQRNIERLAFIIERESKQVTPVRTGFLRSSIRPIMGHLMATIGPLGVPYGIFVHDGTRFMRPRPFMLLGTKAATQGFEESFARDVDNHVKEALS